MIYAPDSEIQQFEETLFQQARPRDRMEPHFDPHYGQYRFSYEDCHLEGENNAKKAFSKSKHPKFDGIFCEYLKSPLLPFMKDSHYHDGLSRAKNDYHGQYQDLRINIRDFRIGLEAIAYPDGQRDEGDKNDDRKAAQIEEMAQVMASELKWEARWRRVVNFCTLNFSDEDIAEKRFGDYAKLHFGARAMYKKLYEIQEKPAGPLGWLGGRATKYNWDLPHPDDPRCPFTERDIREVAYHEERDVEIGVGLEQSAQILMQDGVEAERVAGWLKPENAQMLTEGVAQMHPEQREESVELAREILRKLRKVCSERAELAGEVRIHEREDMERGHLISGFANNYLQLYRDLLLQDPSIMNDSTFDRARLAIGKLGHLTVDHAMLGADGAQYNELKASYDTLPEEYKKIDLEDTEEAMIRDLEVAIDEIGKRMNVSRQVAPHIRSNAMAAVQELGSVMTNAYIAGAPPSLVEKAYETAAVNRPSQAYEEPVISNEQQAVQYYR